MAINAAGLDLIKRFEGLRTESYDDGFGTWTSRVDLGTVEIEVVRP